MPAVPPGATKITYGPAPSQFATLRLPTGASAPVPVVVLIHGGFWRSAYDLSLMDPLGEDLVQRGDAVWNIEYRRVGEAGGGWPGTLEDVAAAIDQLAIVAADHPLDLTNVVVIGHSAGGHLALWSAGRSRLTDGQPGAHPKVQPRLAIGQGPVFDLTAAANAGLGSGAVTDFMGGAPVDVPERYAVATPTPTPDSRLVVVRGQDDDVVPAQFAVPALVGGVEVVDVVGADHFALIDPTTSAWAAVIELLARQ